MNNKPVTVRKRWLRYLLACCAILVLWSIWAELNPQQEREIRVQFQEQLEERLPAAMQPPAGRYGLFPQTAQTEPHRALRVVLVHGLDEPGDIWADLLPVLDDAGFASFEFRYPNDQGVDRSADLLAAAWTELPDDLPVVLIGHSMGGLVIREFVSRYRQPLTNGASLAGAEVHGVILAGTPNQGADLARLRVLLELRDQWAAAQQTGFSPLAGLIDGTGAAKIDLQPNSHFLTELNARPWPSGVAIHIIGGLLMESVPALGDGVVPADSLAIAGEPPPHMVPASHRGMLIRLFEGEDEPQAIPVIMSFLNGLENNR